MIKIINQIGIYNLLNLDKKLDSIKSREGKYYGKPPKFYEQIDPLTEREYLFDEVIYLKIFLNQFNINTDFLYSKLTENLTKAEKLYTNNFLTAKVKDSIGSTSMTIFFNILSILYNENISKNNEKLKYFYKAFVNAPKLNKFPLLYVKYLEEYNQILSSDENPEKFNQIIQNLISISTVRNFTPKEEELFFQIIDTNDIKQKLLLGRTSKIISFEYTVNNHIPNIFEIIEYNLNFKSELTLADLKIKSINLFFNNQERNKAFFDNQYQISKNNELNLSYKILIKDTDKNLKLKSVRFELINKEEHSIYLEINLKTDKDKIITIKNLATNVLEFSYPKNIQMALDQYYNYECEITKIDDFLEVDNIILKFTVNDENEENIMTKSVIASQPRNKLAKSLTNLDAFSSNISIENFKEETQFEKLPSDYTLSLFEHEIITKNSENVLSHHQNSVIIKILKIENNQPVKCNFLIRFCDIGKYSIKLEADYKIMRKEIYDDTSYLKHNGLTKIEVKVPFTIKYE